MVLVLLMLVLLLVRQRWSLGVSAAAVGGVGKERMQRALGC